MIHLRGCWLANGSDRSRLRERRAALEEAQRRINASLVFSSKGWPAFIELSTKREARLIQKQNYIQQGGN